MNKNNILNQQDITESLNKTPATLNAQIIHAEKNSLLIAIPMGLMTGLIAYYFAPVFPTIYSLLIGIGTTVIGGLLLFYFKFGKHLPKHVVPDTEDSLLPPEPYEPIKNMAARAYNLANGNPPMDFIIPKRDY